MRKLLVFSSLFLSWSALALVETADIGFHNADVHISTDLTTLNDEPALRFSLASNVDSRATAIGTCTYSQSSLEREVGAIEDPKVKSDFKWIFVRDDFSSAPIEAFYPQFKALLERANPKCKLPDLPQLKDQLAVDKG